MRTSINAQPIPYESLQDGSSIAAEYDFVERLHVHGFVIIRFPTAAETEIALLRGATDLFSLEPRDFKRMGATYVGCRDGDSIDVELPEAHKRTCNCTDPELSSPGMSEALATLLWRLDGMARQLLRLLAIRGLGVDAEALLASLDLPRGGADDGSDWITVVGNGRSGRKRAKVASPAHPAVVARDISSSIIRGRRDDSAEDAANGAATTTVFRQDEEILLDSHADPSLLTFSTLWPGTQGLQMRDAASPEDGWLDVEAVDGIGPLDVEVHVGDFLSFLSRNYFPSCVHRVTRPRSGPGRLSFPFLVRPRNDYELDTRGYDPMGTNEWLVKISGIPCTHLRKLFDARGKRLHDARQESEAENEARKTRAKAYKEALRARGTLANASDVKDEVLKAAGEVGISQRVRSPKYGAAQKAKDAAFKSKTGSTTISKGESPASANTTPLATSTPPPSSEPLTALRPPSPTGSISSTTVSASTTAGSVAGSDRFCTARWALCDLAALLYGSEYLFVFKQHDLHMDHPEEPVTLDTMLNANFPSLADANTAFGFRHVHQLDYATSGVLCVALNRKAAKAASTLFQKRLVSKIYLALVAGHTSWDVAQCSKAIGEDPTDPRGFRMALEGASSGCISPAPSHTELVTVARGYLHGKPVSKLLLRPTSGRRHQLRLHAMALGHTIVGDVAYGGDRAAERMMLHAWRLRLPLPKLDAPVCITTADPFPICGSAPQANEAVRLLPDELEFFDTARILCEMRPRGQATIVPGPAGIPGGAALLSFNVLAPAGRPRATQRGQALVTSPATIPPLIDPSYAAALSVESARVSAVGAPAARPPISSCLSQDMFDSCQVIGREAEKSRTESDIDENKSRGAALVVAEGGWQVQYHLLFAGIGVVTAVAAVVGVVQLAAHRRGR